MHNVLAHLLQHGLCLVKRGHRSTDHERERAGLGASHAARHRRVDREQAGLVGLLGQGARHGGVDGRAVDQQRALLDRAHDVTVDVGHVRRRRQHRDQHVGFAGQVLWRV